MTIGTLARKFGLSRGTLLHYDTIGLLCPPARTEAKYRIYSAADEERLGRICLYRSAGIALADIRRMLDDPKQKGYVEVLRRRLGALSEEIVALKRQQQLIVRLMGRHGTDKENSMLTKDQWVALMRATGLSDDDMLQWHREFEKMSGEAHEEFLESLGIGAGEVKQIRAKSR
jgi:DNA-binding transcriptional MerR regulator